MAFTVTADHARQEQVWQAISGSWQKEPYQIRRMLTEKAVRASDRRAVFVGLDAYEQATIDALHAEYAKLEAEYGPGPSRRWCRRCNRPAGRGEEARRRGGQSGGEAPCRASKSCRRLRRLPDESCVPRRDRRTSVQARRARRRLPDFPLPQPFWPTSATFTATPAASAMISTATAGAGSTGAGLPSASQRSPSAIYIGEHSSRCARSRAPARTWTSSDR